MVQQTLFNLLKEALFNIDSGALNVDVDVVRKEAEIQEVSSLIYPVLKKKGILSKEKDALWRKFITPRLAKGNGVFLCHAEVSSLFTKNNISYTTIKGVASASYYSEPFSRTMGDTDVIVKECDFDKAAEILVNNGYIQSENNGDYHTEFYKNSMTVELHRSLKGIPENKITEVDVFLKDMFERAKKYPTVFGEVTVPSDFHHGLIMLLHMYGHLFSSGMGLRHLCDWAVFIEKFSDTEFSELFEKKLKAIGLWQFAVKISQACTRIGVSYKKWMGNIDKEFCDFFIDDVMAGGNFGRKDKDRRAMISFTPGTDEKRSAPLVQYFKYGIKQIKAIWPFFGKYKIFMPVGFIMYCFRILYRLITKKSRLYDLSEGYERRDFYEQLKCFEKEN